MRKLFALLALSTLAAGCNSLHHTERSWTNGKLDFEWETRAFTFLAVKQIEYVIDAKSEKAMLSGKGISSNATKVALAGIAESPEVASAIITAMRPGGLLENALADLGTTDPDLAAAIAEAMEEEPTP
jgi:hypothetical protein